MRKIMKPNKVVLVLSGRYAGRKAIVVKTFDDGSSDKQFGHALVAGVDRYPRKVTNGMGKAKLKKRSKIKPFLKVSYSKQIPHPVWSNQCPLLPPPFQLVNYNHLMPTRYSVDIPFEKINPKDLKDPVKRKTHRFQTRVKFEERYKAGKNKWFFTKLRF